MCFICAIVRVRLDLTCCRQTASPGALLTRQACWLGNRSDAVSSTPTFGGRCCRPLPTRSATWARLAVDETVILLNPPLPLVGVSTVMERERQQK